MIALYYFYYELNIFYRSVCINICPSFEERFMIRELIRIEKVYILMCDWCGQKKMYQPSYNHTLFYISNRVLWVITITVVVGYTYSVYYGALGFEVFAKTYLIEFGSIPLKKRCRREHKHKTKRVALGVVTHQPKTMLTR